jgi:hypothetical protein
LGGAEKQPGHSRRFVMPGLGPGMQAAPSVIMLRTPALDARVKPAHDETERVAGVASANAQKPESTCDPTAEHRRRFQFCI